MPRTRNKSRAISETKISLENDDSGLSTISTMTSADKDPPVPRLFATPLIKLKPLGDLISDNNKILAEQFIYGENSLSNPFTEITEPGPTVTVIRPEDNSILLSDSEYIPDVKEVPKTKSTGSNKTKAKQEKEPVTPRKRHKFQKQLKGNYHKLTDFFALTPKRNAEPVNKSLVDKKVELFDEKVPLKSTETTDALKERSLVEVQQKKESEENRSVTKFGLPRTIDESTELKNKSHRYLTRDQTKLAKLNDPSGAGEGCSHFQINATQCPDENSTEFNVIEEKKGSDHSEVKNDDVISISSSISDAEDNQYIPPTQMTPRKRRRATTTTTSKGRGRKAKSATSTKSSGKKKECPDYKIIKGTTFAVDAFQFGVIDQVTHYFLTHFHSDHYRGLTRKFAHPLYMSTVTANLVRKILKIEEKYINTLDLNNPVIVGDVEVTALDANHCPGAVMFVFRLPDGQCILHVGDFRARPEMESETVFWNNHVHCIYLDTTYLTGKYNHPTQTEAIDGMIRSVDEYREQNIGEKYVIIIGTYVIGKEKVWSSLARHLECRVWLEKSRREAVECYEDSSLLELVEVDPTKALIHVLPLQNLFYENILQYLSQFEDVYSKALAIRPSGWERGSRVQRRGPVTIIGVQYSEHSSYNELERFVRHLQPDEVISTVPYGKDLAKVPKIPQKWLVKAVEPKRSGQQSITSFLKVKRSPSSSQNVADTEEECEDGALDLSMRVSPNRSISDI